MCANHICTTLTPTNNQDHPLASLAFAHSCCFVVVNAASSKVFVRFAYPGLLSSASDNAVFVVGLFKHIEPFPPKTTPETRSKPQVR